MTADIRFKALAAEMSLDFSGDIKIGGNYSPVVRDGKQLWVSGQIPRVGDEVLFVGVWSPWPRSCASRCTCALRPTLPSTARWPMVHQMCFAVSWDQGVRTRAHRLA